MNRLGIMSGLVIGKPLGILTFAWLAVKTKFSSLPSSVTWRHIAAAGLLAGIGFTMSIFITLLAFGDNETVVNSKIAILGASLVAAIAGLLMLKSINRKTVNQESSSEDSGK